MNARVTAEANLVGKMAVTVLSVVLGSAIVGSAASIISQGKQIETILERIEGVKGQLNGVEDRLERIERDRPDGILAPRDEGPRHPPSSNYGGKNR